MNILDLPDQKDLPFVQRLGIPLRVLATPDLDPEGRPNTFVPVTFGFVVDPKDARFRVSDPSFYPLLNKGRLLLYRADGLEIHTKHVEALTAYVGQTLDELRSQSKAVNEQEKFTTALFVPQTDVQARAKAEKVVERLLTPEAFADFFENYRAKRADSDKAWEQVTSSATTPKAQPHRTSAAGTCGGCGAGEGEGGTVLMQCAKCRKQMYCGRECQKKDWREHKLVCRAG